MRLWSVFSNVTSLLMFLGSVNPLQGKCLTPIFYQLLPPLFLISRLASSVHYFHTALAAALPCLLPPSMWASFEQEGCLENSWTWCLLMGSLYIVWILEHFCWCWKVGRQEIICSSLRMDDSRSKEYGEQNKYCGISNCLYTAVCSAASNTWVCLVVW